jgi:hypothetical protein
VHCNKFFLIKTTGCTNFTNLFWRETLYVLEGSSVHHHENIHCTLSTGICRTEISQMGKDYWCIYVYSVVKILKICYRYNSMIYKKIWTIKYSRKYDRFCRYSIILRLHTRFVDSFLAGPGWNWFYSVVCWYWSTGLVGSDVWNVSCISRYMGLFSPVLCSKISCLWFWCVWMHSCFKVVALKFCRYVLIKTWCYYWDHICVCCSGWAVYKLNGDCCVLYILCVPGISVWRCGFFVQCMPFGMCYMWVYRYCSCPVPEYYWPVLVLYVVLGYW